MQPVRSVRRTALAAASALAVSLIAATGAQAATFTVNVTTDPAPGAGECGLAGDCSLRQAIDRANTTAGDDTIVLPAGSYGLTITGPDEDADQTGDLDVLGTSGAVTSGALTITGAGARTTTIDASALADRAFHVVGGDLTISGVTVRGAQLTSRKLIDGGGAFLDEGALTVTDSALLDNTVNEGGGGAIATAGAATGLTVERVLIDGNSISTATGQNNVYGGGLDLDADAPTRVANTTISNNSATNNGPPMSVAGGSGGVDIDSQGAAVEFVNDTITANTTVNALTPEAVYASSGNVFRNTIIANNSAGDCSPGNTGQPDHVLDSDGSCVGQAPTSGNKTADPLLGGLTNNGGPTDTFRLLAGSPAIDAGTNTGCPAVDQRSVTRPQGAACDIGAYEVGPAPVAVIADATSVTTTSARLTAQ